MILWTLLVLGLMALVILAALRTIDERAAEESAPYEPPVHIITAAPTTYRVRYPIDLSDDMQDYIIELCKEYGLDPAVVMAVIETESGCDRLAMSEDYKDYGLMQIRVEYHKDRMQRLHVVDILDAADNVLVGCDYLAELVAEERGIEWALTAYNAGHGTADEIAAAGHVSFYATEVLNLADYLDEEVEIVER